jgi:hypothetical protein
MQQPLFYNVKIGILTLLVTALAAEHYLSYDSLFDVPAGRREQSVPNNIAMIDQHLKRYSYAKYQHVIADNIFSEKIVVEPQPVPQVKLAIKPFTVQLEVRGIAITPERKMVVIWDKQKKASQVLLEKEEIYRWKVVSIEKQMVIMEHESGRRYEFQVNEETLMNADWKI